MNSWERIASKNSCSSDELRFWAAALLVFALLIYAGLGWVPPRSPGEQGRKPVTVRQVLQVDLRVSPLLNVNEATEDELQELPGIGPVLARRIVEYRLKHGPFSTLEELTEVSGIGLATLDRLRGSITLE